MMNISRQYADGFFEIVDDYVDYLLNVVDYVVALVVDYMYRIS